MYGKAVLFDICCHGNNLFHCNKLQSVSAQMHHRNQFMSGSVILLKCSVAYIDVQRNPHCLSLLMTRHVVPMDSDPVLLKLSLSRPYLEMFLSADGVLTEIVFMSEMLCSKHQSQLWGVLLTQITA